MCRMGLVISRLPGFLPSVDAKVLMTFTALMPERRGLGDDVVDFIAM